MARQRLNAVRSEPARIVATGRNRHGSVRVEIVPYVPGHPAGDVIPIDESRRPRVPAPRDGAHEHAGCGRRRPSAWRQRLRVVAPVALCILVLAGCGAARGNAVAHQAPDARSASPSASASAQVSRTTVQPAAKVPGQWGIYQAGRHCAARPRDALAFHIASYHVSRSEADVTVSVDNRAALPVSLIAPRRLSARILRAHNATVQSLIMPTLPTELPGCAAARLTFAWSHGAIAGEYTLELAVGVVRYETSSGAFTEHIPRVTCAFRP